jgi:hypothetical protein
MGESRLRAARRRDGPLYREVGQENAVSPSPDACRLDDVARGHFETGIEGREENGQPGQPLPTFKTGINFVRVDVIASTSKGEPVVDLKKEDFIVTEDGKPQTVE